MIAKTPLPTDPPTLKAAFACLGLREVKGAKHNPKIVKMYAEVGHAWVKDDETAWCAAFAGAILKSVGLPHTGSLAARSYLSWGKATRTPKRGDVVVFTRGTGWQGHVAFYLGEEKGRVWHIGGNQSDGVTVTSTPASKVLGYRTPMKLNPLTGNSATTKAQALIGAGAATSIGTAAIEAGMESGDSGIGEMLSQLGYALLSMQLGAWLAVIGVVGIGAGIYWTWRERKRFWTDKGF